MLVCWCGVSISRQRGASRLVDALPTYGRWGGGEYRDAAGTASKQALVEVVEAGRGQQATEIERDRERST